MTEELVGAERRWRESQGARELEETRKGSGLHSHVHVPTDGGRLALTHICIPRAIT